MPLTPDELAFARRFVDVLMEGTYCPDPSIFPKLIAAAEEAEQLRLELDAMTTCAEDRRERAKRAEREVEELRRRYEPSSFRKDID